MSAENIELQPLPVGVLGRPHGVRGELVYHPHNPHGVRLEALKFPFAAFLGGDPRGGPNAHAATTPVRLAGARSFQDGALVRLEGIVDRDAAAAFTNRELLVPRGVLPPLAPGEFYVADLVGCAVFDLTGGPRGTVVGAYWNGHQDVVAVQGPDGAELLFPAVPEFLHEVDLGARRLVIDDHE